MNLFGSRRRIAEKDERIAWLESRVKQLNMALGATRSEAGDHFRRSERFAGDIESVTKKLTAARLQNATLLIDSERYRAEIKALRRSQQLREKDLLARIKLLEDRNEALRDANEHHYRDLAAAAGVVEPQAADSIAA
ncbi:hypothetical protein ACFXDE_01625 [Kitasatospora sp. NPDC059408]|uniref:hypothetical protein n=1 Tax=Kitasatospora sp. NPDC059408 TaxID=3346823 RepID=UPI0036871834